MNSSDYFMGYGPMGGYAPSYLSTMGGRTSGGTNTNIVWTMGIESAKAYPLLPGRTLLLMDSESPKFYIKTVDNNGYAAIRAYAFHEEQPTTAPVTNDTSKFVTQEQLEAALAAVIEKVAPKACGDTKAVNETNKNLL